MGGSKCLIDHTPLLLKRVSNCGHIRTERDLREGSSCGPIVGPYSKIFCVAMKQGCGLVFGLIKCAVIVVVVIVVACVNISRVVKLAQGYVSSSKCTYCRYGSTVQYSHGRISLKKLMTASTVHAYMLYTTTSTTTAVSTWFAN